VVGVTAVSGVLLVDVSPAVDDFRILCTSEAARLIPVIPPGVPVRLLIGAATATDGALGQVGAVLRSARMVEVVGSDVRGVAEIRRLFAVAFLRVAP
jgi:hypothetical protein